MKQILTSFLLLFSLTISAQTTVVTGPKKKPQTTTTTKSKTQTTQSKQQVQKTSQKNSSSNVYNVRTAAEFLDALGSNRTIRVMSHFDITPTLNSYVAKNKIKTADGSNPYYTTSGVYARGEGGKHEWWEIVLYNINNLTIEGVNLSSAHIQTEIGTVAVLSYEQCSNIKLKNLTLGHVEQGFCGAGVVEVNNCANITIDNCDLYGCGTYGICAYDSDNCTFNNSTIRDCSYGIMILERCKGFHFSNSRFTRNKDYGLLIIKNCSNVDYSNCRIAQNKGTLFELNCNVYFRGCTINHDTSKMGTTNYAIIR